MGNLFGRSAAEEYRDMREECEEMDADISMDIRKERASRAGHEFDKADAIKRGNKADAVAYLLSLQRCDRSITELQNRRQGVHEMKIALDQSAGAENMTRILRQFHRLLTRANRQMNPARLARFQAQFEHAKEQAADRIGDVKEMANGAAGEDALDQDQLQRAAEEAIQVEMLASVPTVRSHGVAVAIDSASAPGQRL